MNKLIQITPTMDVVVQTNNVTDIETLFTSEKGLDEQVAIITQVAKNAIIDISSEQGRKELKLLAKNISSAKKKLDEEGKRICDYLKTRPKLVDATRKRMRDALEALEAEILLPLTEIENRQKKIQKIKEMHLPIANASSEEIRQALENVKSIVLTTDEWKESLDDARKAVHGEVNVLTTMLNLAEKHEKEAAELEELRKKQEEAERIVREEKIRKEAEEKAKAEANAEKARIEEENRRLKEEIGKAKSQQQQKVEKPATSESLKKAAAELKEALLPLVGGDAEMARNIGIAIYRGQLPHVTFTP